MITQHFVLNCLQANCCPWPWMVDTGTDGPVTLTTWVNNLRYRHGPELEKSQTDTQCLYFVQFGLIPPPRTSFMDAPINNVHRNNAKKSPKRAKFINDPPWPG